MQEVLYAKSYNIHETEQERYFVQTRSQTESSGIVMPEVQGMKKGVDPNLKPEKQVVRPLGTSV